MKNSKGIVFKVGQVWESEDGITRRVLAIDKDLVVYKYREASVNETTANDPVFRKLIEYKGANLKQARKDGWKIWVEGMDKPDPKKIEELYRYDTFAWLEVVGPHAVSLQRTSAYRYKLKAEPQEPKRLEVELLWGDGMGRHEQQSPEYRKIGYKYAESDILTTVGPHAWWEARTPRNNAPKAADYAGLEHCPIFATHAVYMRVEEGSGE